MFRSSFFIWFFIIVVATFSLSVNVAEASFWSVFWTVIAAVVTVALVVLTGGGALALLGINLMTGSVSLGGISAALITTGVACGTGLICGGSTENPIAIVSSGTGNCSSDNGMRFFDTEPGVASPDDQIAIYRFSIVPDPAFLDYYLAIWMGSKRGFNVRDPMAPGFYDAANDGTGRAYVETESNSYANYLSDVGISTTPIRIARYGDICSQSGVCQILDQSAPENSYVIYAAKVLKNYPRVHLSGGDGTLLSLDNKFLTAVAGSPATFPYFNYAAYQDCGGNSACRRVAGQWYRPGTVFAGPFRVSALDPATCPAPVTPVAVVNTAQTGCNFVTLSVTPANAETYDVLRDGATIATNISSDEQVYNDTGLAPATTYRYRVIARKGSETGESNEVTTATSACAAGAASALSAQTALLETQCEAVTLGVTTENATFYHVFRDGAPVAVNIPATETRYADSDLDQNTAYSYVVRATNGVENVDSAALGIRTPDCGSEPRAIIALGGGGAGAGECTAVTLSVVVENAATYDVLRDGVVIVTGISASQTTYRDAPLTRSTNYSYTVIAHGSFGRNAESNVLPTRTACFPACTFGASPESIVRGETSRLGWSCREVDACAIDGASVAVPEGTKTVAPTANTTYTLRCENADGSTTTQTTINVTRPGLREVPP
ncbi:MAG: hypothetical protein Q7R85_02765 [bacterium]|nr:hypothetical protein [bacterium]